MEKAFSVMDIAAYYFPNYHLDARNEARHGRGWTEWELMKCARPRFERHDQPKVSLWGYEDEADPAVMAKKIAAAAKYEYEAGAESDMSLDGKPSSKDDWRSY